MRIRVFEWLTSVWAVIAAFVLGALIGVYAPGAAPFFARIGDVYVTFLIMCVPPVLVTALSTSIARILTDPQAGKHLGRTALGLLASMVVAAGLGVAGIVIFGSGSNLSAEAQLILGNMLKETGTAVGTSSSWGEVLMGLVPQNLLAALAEGNYPQILFMSVLFGLLLGFVRLPATERMLELLELVYQLFQQAIMWSTYVLPFAVVGIIAGQVAQAGAELVVALGRLVLAQLAVLVGAGVLGATVMRGTMKLSWQEQWQAMRRPLTFGFATQSSMAAMPLLMEALEELRLPRSRIQLVVPLCVLVGRHAFVMYGAMALAFAMQLYHLPVTAAAAANIVFGSAFIAAATAGMPAVPFLTALTIVARPVGVPLEAVIPMLLAVLPIVDPLGTAAAVQVQGAISSLIIGPRKSAVQAPGRDAPASAPTAASTS
ncbi:MAG TPA: cation:dicarboxylase symporter family transporter [Limnochordales bacterium]